MRLTIYHLQTPHAHLYSYHPLCRVSPRGKSKVCCPVTILLPLSCSSPPTLLTELFQLRYHRLLRVDVAVDAVLETRPFTLVDLRSRDLVGRDALGPAHGREGVDIYFPPMISSRLIEKKKKKKQRTNNSLSWNLAFCCSFSMNAWISFRSFSLKSPSPRLESASAIVYVTTRGGGFSRWWWWCWWFGAGCEAHVDFWRVARDVVGQSLSCGMGCHSRCQMSFRGPRRSGRSGHRIVASDIGGR
jgi:hypothetical protein